MGLVVHEGDTPQLKDVSSIQESSFFVKPDTWFNKTILICLDLTCSSHDGDGEAYSISDNFGSWNQRLLFDDYQTGRSQKMHLIMILFLNLMV